MLSKLKITTVLLLLASNIEFVSAGHNSDTLLVNKKIEEPHRPLDFCQPFPACVIDYIKEPRPEVPDDGDNDVDGGDTEEEERRQEALKNMPYILYVA